MSARASHHRPDLVSPASSGMPTAGSDEFQALLADAAAMRARAVADRQWAKDTQLRAVHERQRVASALQELKIAFDDRVRMHEQRRAEQTAHGLP